MRAFVSNRGTRVVIPLVVGWIVFFPMVATAMVWARGAAPPPGEILRQAALSFPLAYRTRPRWWRSARRSSSGGCSSGNLTCLRVIERRWALHFVLAVSLTAACLSITGLAPEYMRAAGRFTLSYAFFYTVSVWCWTFAVLGIGLRFFAGESSARRYVADASYWIYLAHLPVVFWLQLAVNDLPWHWSVKFAVIMTSPWSYSLPAITSSCATRSSVRP